MEFNLTITNEDVKKLRQRNLTGEQVLDELFKGTFEEKKYFDLSKLKLKLNSSDGSIFSNCDEAGLINCFIAIRDAGVYKNKAFFLLSCYNWELIYDENHILCLLPTKKKNKSEFIQKI